ncbi:MAG: hypothetical protein EOP11_25290 [Proteobacteria bacterium]|nr:MAG: hypothetical protein EOP11_25290 [Pseudomonadota bacterium]
MSVHPGSVSHDEIVAFLRLCVDSVESLEVLGLLLDSPDREWTAKALSIEIRSSEGSVNKRLHALSACRVIAVPSAPTFRYQAGSPEMARLAPEVIAFYRLRPHRVMEILYNKPESAMQSFADAFRFNKKENP